MKLKYIFPLFIAILTLMISCADEESVTLLDEIQVSSSYVAIPMKGGSTSITVTAKESWTAEKVTTDKNKVEWLTISTTTGNAGETELTFTAPEAVDGRAAEVLLHCGGKTQRINIGQGVVKATAAKVAEVNAGPDGKTFRVTGVCTKIENTTYGNWFITDKTGTLYIYGTLDKKNAEKNFLSLGLEVGDEVTVEGPKSTYKGTPQLVKVTVVEINKSLVKVDSVENEVIPVEGGEFTAYLTCKGQGVSVEIPEDAKSWLSISSIQSAGTNAVVKFKAAANTGGDRGTTLTFRTTDGSKEYSTETTLSQKGAIVKASVAEFIAAAVGDTQYRLTGVITSIAHATYGNLYIRDFSGETYVYGIKDFTTKGLKVGDIITIVGKRAEYKGTPQVASAVLESVIPVTAATIAEVLTKPDSSQDYYMVTGEITSIADAVYGNLYLKDGGSEIYLYGCYPGYGATGDARKNLLATKGIKVGDTLTVIATKSSYSGAAQLANGFYFSHVSAE
ncbi:MULTISPECIES: BACON domain-containing protein [unclassified Proteiniphilum]|jgi:DNA/RNA endonuclease YhcR with UshA esterase domain|uniref:BACON domain-containing protein n=1 Tax=Proteiniphilum sp. UBA5431 TaxID=1947280 RepID=UPI000EB91E54|nr:MULTISPECIES: BACON domain-containing protein [unclassified Proteiniphilum]HCF80326.1 DNA-binding protein [Porphyromonadaceae bacterium]